jgi:hypothetical protein
MSSTPSLSICITGAGSGARPRRCFELGARGTARAIRSMSWSCALPPRKSKLNLRVENVDLLKTSERTFLAEQDIDMLINSAAVRETGPIAEQPLREPQPVRSQGRTPRKGES